MLFATGRLLAGQALTLLASTLPVITLIVALVVTRDVSAGIAATAVATFAIALGRLAHAHAIFSRETKGVARAAAKTSLGSVITTGLALRTAELLPNSAYPHALAVFASGEVPSAIPARTYANACRIVSQQFVNILHVHITRRMAGTDAERRRGLSEYALAARFLCSCQLVLVGLAACAADVVVALWLPNQRDAIQEALPGLLVEQALLSASLPVWISLIAEGRMRLLGGVRLSGALAGLALLIPALLMWPPQALGLACAVSAVPLFVFGALWEGRWATRLQLPWRVVATRYLPALVAALLCAGFRAAPLAIGGVVVLMGAAWLPSSLRGIWGVLRASPAAAGGATIRVERWTRRGTGGRPPGRRIGQGRGTAEPCRSWRTSHRGPAMWWRSDVAMESLLRSRNGSFATSIPTWGSMAISPAWTRHAPTVSRRVR
jgi:hypothetical protein